MTTTPSDPESTPTVLFLCVHNAGRSQMALGFFSHLAGDHGVAWSGGSEPGTEINPARWEVAASGGGITHLSKLADEYQEMKNKIYVPVY